MVTPTMANIVVFVVASVVTDKHVRVNPFCFWPKQALTIRYCTVSSNIFTT